MKKLLLAVIAAALLMPSLAQGELIAYWNFNSLSISSASAPGTGGVPTSILADAGTGTLSLSNWGGTVDDFAGNISNAIAPDAAGASLSLLGGGTSPGPYPGNQTFIQLSFSMTGLSDLEISYWTRRTSTGFNSNQWSWSTDGTNFSSFQTGINPSDNSAGELLTFNTAVLDNASTAYLRYTLDGASSASGNNRIDNLQLNAVPEPTAILMVGMAVVGCVVRRRRIG